MQLFQNYVFSLRRFQIGARGGCTHYSPELIPVQSKSDFFTNGHTFESVGFCNFVNLYREFRIDLH